MWAEKGALPAQDSYGSMTNSTEWGMRSMQDDPIRIPGAARTSSTFLPRPRVQGSTVRSTRTWLIGKKINKPQRRRDRGFTLIELMIVISMILILVSISIPAYNQSILRAKESVLRQDLFQLRSLISQYTLDKQKAPQGAR